MALTYTCNYHFNPNPDSKIHGANMGHVWGRPDPGKPHVGPMYYLGKQTYFENTNFQN